MKTPNDLYNQFLFNENWTVFWRVITETLELNKIHNWKAFMVSNFVNIPANSFFL